MDGSAADLTSYKKRQRSRGSKSSRSSKSDGSASDSNRSTSSNGGRKKKDGFSSKIHIPEFGGKKGQSSDVTEAFRQWARCITYYRDLKRSLLLGRLGLRFLLDVEPDK